jgi:hypothetical protein
MPDDSQGVSRTQEQQSPRLSVGTQIQPQSPMKSNLTKLTPLIGTISPSSTGTGTGTGTNAGTGTGTGTGAAEIGLAMAYKVVSDSSLHTAVQCKTAAPNKEGVSISSARGNNVTCMDREKQTAPDSATRRVASRHRELRSSGSRSTRVVWVKGLRAKMHGVRSNRWQSRRPRSIVAGAASGHITSATSNQ